MTLSEKIKEAATTAFRDNIRLAEMSLNERGQATQWYEQVVRETVGTRAELARLYNLERARFLAVRLRESPAPLRCLVRK